MAINYRVFFCAIYLVCCTLPIVAQQTNDVKDVTKSINTIKRDNQYLYAETTMRSLDEAYDGAKAILETVVSDWIHEQYPNEDIELCIVKAKDHCLQLQTQRGNFYRAFVYVRKNDIMPVADQNEVTVFQVEPQKGESADAHLSTMTNTSEPQAITLSEEELRMKVISQFDEIEPYIKGLKTMDKVTNYGKYTTMPSNSPCHLFIYNQQGEVVAVLRKDSSKTINLRTMRQDEITNYKNCGAIWFQLKPAQQ